MFQNSENEKLTQKNLEKNLKMMGLSAIVLIVLFGYTLIKSENTIQGSGYYIGVGFLFVLLILTLFLQKYKDRIQKIIPKNKFQQQLDQASQKIDDEVTTKDQKTTAIESTSSNISFKDIAGIEDIKGELEEVVDFLNNPKKYQKYGVNLPKGVLLVGPPGVGKTLIARAVAGEADVPFFYQSGASFVHIYVGMGAKKVRELFTAAKAQAPSIIFIDEIDAVGKMRGVGSNDEREATLNELLTQMDGFNGSSGVMVIAATNKIEVLDDALLRAGRFDRRVFLSLPSKEDRVKILNLYLKDKKANFDIEKLATQTSGFNSSALATLINEALLNMIKRDGTIILEDDITIAKQKIEFGKKQIQILTDDQKEILATYQASKAFVSQTNLNLFDQGIEQRDIVFASKSQLEQKIKNYLAGSVALEVLKNEPYAVFEDEIKRAYEIASNMVERYKMDDSIDHIIKNCRAKLKDEILENKDQLERLKQILLKDEKIVF